MVLCSLYLEVAYMLQFMIQENWSLNYNLE
jgi:hypothetical protein